MVRRIFSRFQIDVDVNQAVGVPRFSVINRAKSLVHAVRGVWIFIRTTHNAWVEIFFLILMIIMGICFRISYVDWMLLVLAMGMVLVAEAFNTAIEIDIDLTSPQYHPYARDTKDVAAGAVLISSIIAAVIGIGIFGHYALAFFSYALW